MYTFLRSKGKDIGVALYFHASFMHQDHEKWVPISVGLQGFWPERLHMCSIFHYSPRLGLYSSQPGLLAALHFQTQIFTCFPEVSQLFYTLVLCILSCPLVSTPYCHELISSSFQLRWGPQLAPRWSANSNSETDWILLIGEEFSCLFTGLSEEGEREQVSFPFTTTTADHTDRNYLLYWSVGTIEKGIKI